jgi:hypothetical protein
MSSLSQVRTCCACGTSFEPAHWRQAYCTVRCRWRSKAQAERRRQGMAVRPPGVPTRPCCICGARIAWWQAAESLWTTTDVICGNHLDQGHCLEHCYEEDAAWRSA